MEHGFTTTASWAVKCPLKAQCWKGGVLLLSIVTTARERRLICSRYLYPYMIAAVPVLFKYSTSDLLFQIKLQTLLQTLKSRKH